MSAHRAILLGACFWGLVAAGALLLWRCDPAPGSSRGPESRTETTADPMRAEAIHPSRDADAATAPVPVEPTALYPDGSTARLLNGVVEPMVVTWPDRVPFTPIVGTYRDGPPHYWDWYVHEDGTHSTVAMFRALPDAEPVPTSLVRHPRKINPMRATGDGRFVPVR